MKRFAKIMRNESGFTLVELILASALLLMVLTMTYNFFEASHNFTRKNLRRSDLQGQLRVIMLGIKNELATAQGGWEDSSTGSIEGAPVSFGNDSLGTPATGEVWYYVKNGELMKKDSSGVETIAFLTLVPELEVQFKPVIAGETEAGVTSYDFQPLVEVTLISGEVSVTSEMALLNQKSDGWPFEPSTLDPSTFNTSYPDGFPVIKLTPTS